MKVVVSNFYFFKLVICTISLAFNHVSHASFGNTMNSGNTFYQNIYQNQWNYLLKQAAVSVVYMEIPAPHLSF